MSGASEAIVPSQLDGPFGQAIVDAARELDPLAARATLTRAFPTASTEALRAAVTQAQLQQRAAARFPQAKSLWWTADGLEQASRPAASAYRATTLRAAGVTRGVDLTCGLGLDLITMAQAGLPMIGVERDPVIADLAARNVARLGLADRVEIITGSCEDAAILGALPRAAAWFIDPARRTGVRRADGTHVRLRDPEQWSPQWSWVVNLSSAVGPPGGPDVLVVKTSPSIAHELVATGATQWLSVGGEVVEATVWWGLGAPGSRCAVLLDDARPDTAELVPAPESVTVCAKNARVDVTGLPAEGEWLIEPDPAVIRAGAVADLAEAINATLVDEHLAYLSATAPLPSDDPRGRSRRVLYSGNYRPEALRRACAAAGVTRVDLSGRGRRLDPQRVNRELRLPGGPGNIVTLFSLGLGSPRRTAVVLGAAPAQTPLWK